MSRSDGSEELVCHCMAVTQAQLERAIRDQGARSVEDLQRLTAACCGCGTCRWDVEDLLARVVAEVEADEA